MDCNQHLLFTPGGITCDKCGEDSPNDYLHTLHHSRHPVDGMCHTQRSALTRIAYWPEQNSLPTLTQHIANARNHRCTETDIQNAITQRTTKGDINMTQRRRRQLDDF